MFRRRRIALALCAACLLLAGSGFDARLAINAHDRADVAPQRFEASVALGKAALSLLITWTRHR